MVRIHAGEPGFFLPERFVLVDSSAPLPRYPAFRSALAYKWRLSGHGNGREGVKKASPRGWVRPREVLHGLSRVVCEDDHGRFVSSVSHLAQVPCCHTADEITCA